MDLKLAVEEPIPVLRRENRTRACRITHKGIYRALGVPNIRHRRFADPGAYLRRLLSLDYVLEHPELEWLPTEEEKVWYCEEVGIPTDCLPMRIYTGAAGSVTRYFPLKLPLAGGRISTFVYVDPGNGTSTELRHWGRAHEHLWAGMRERGITIHVAAIGVNPAADTRARAVLEGWAREETRVAAGSPQEAAFEKELDGVVAWIGAEMEFALFQAVASGDTFEHRPSECGHCVQDFLAELDLGDLPGEAAGLESAADDTLPTADLRFYPAALVVPCGHLPGHAAVAADLSNMAIPNGWIPRRLRSGHCVLWRRYNHIQGLPIPFPQQSPCRRSIIGAVSQKARDRGIELIQEPG